MNMSREKVTWLVIGIVAGVVLRAQIAKIPGVDKLPTV
jgi:hypothetical protein